MFLFGLICLCILSCRKPVDEIPPTLSILLPSDGSTFSVLDTIVVSVDVQDNEGVRSVRAELITVDGQLVHPAYQESVCSNSANITFGYEVDDIHIESGTYYLRITADDGTHIKRSFVEVHLLEVPLALEHVYWIDHDTGNTTLMRGLFEESSEEACLTVSDDMTRLFADRYNGRMMLSNPNGTHLQFVDTKECQLLQDIQLNVGFPGKHAAVFDYEDRLIYSATHGDMIRVYRSNGAQLNALPFPDSDIDVIDITTIANDVVLAARFNGDHFLFYINKSSGALQHTELILPEITAIDSHRESNKVFAYTWESPHVQRFNFQDYQGISITDPVNTGGRIMHTTAWDASPEPGIYICTENGRRFRGVDMNANGLGVELEVMSGSPRAVCNFTSSSVYLTLDSELYGDPFGTYVSLWTNYDSGGDHWIEAMYNK